MLVFEDAENGVDAAHAAGMKCVWVPHAEQDRDTHHHKCSLVLDSLEYFIPEQFGLPAFNSWQKYYIDVQWNPKDVMCRSTTCMNQNVLLQWLKVVKSKWLVLVKELYDLRMMKCHFRV